MKNNYFAFIDETGLLTSDPKQKYFALGLLRVEDVSEFYNKISKLYHKVISKIEAKRKEKLNKISSSINKEELFNLLKNNKRFEFKFNLIDEISVDDYLNLINIYFQFSNLYFCALVIDTQNPTFNFKKFFPNSWEAYIGYSKMIIKNNFSLKEKVAVIADYIQMTHKSTKYFEKDLNLIPNVFNTCRVESDASLFVQVVDVLLGAVVYDFKIKDGIIGKEDPKFPKTKLVKQIRKYLRQDTLAKKFTVNKPSYFNVWPFRSKPE